MRIILYFGLIIVVAQAQALPMVPTRFETFSEKYSELPWVMRESLKQLEKSLKERLFENLGIQRPIPKIWKNFGGMMALRPKFMVQNNKNFYHSIKKGPGSRGPYGARGFYV